MKTLETSLTHSGYNLTQVYRDGMLAIYAAQKSNHLHPHHWEVIRIQISPAFTNPSGTHYPERETYPKSEDWGNHSFTADSLEDARRRLKAMQG